MGSTRFYARAARITAFFHFFWTILLFGGGILVLFYHPYAWYQIGIMTFTILAWFPLGLRCPLTVWERNFQKKAGIYDGNERAFTAKYLSKFFKTDINPKTVSFAIAVFYVASYAVSILILARP